VCSSDLTAFDWRFKRARQKKPAREVYSNLKPRQKPARWWKILLLESQLRKQPVCVLSDLSGLPTPIQAMRTSLPAPGRKLLFAGWLIFRQLWKRLVSGKKITNPALKYVAFRIWSHSCNTMAPNR